MEERRVLTPISGRPRCELVLVHTTEVPNGGAVNEYLGDDGELYVEFITANSILWTKETVFELD